MKTSCSLIALLFLACACAAQPGRPPQAAPETMQMQAHMQQMRGLMQRIHGASDPAERQRLMAEHMQAMQQGMTMMGRMMGGGAMGEHMSMMQMMMGQMRDHMTALPADAGSGDKPPESPPGQAGAQTGQQGEEHSAHH